MSKHHRPCAHNRAQTQKTAVIDNDSQKRLSAAVVKLHIELWDIDSDNENDNYFNYGLSDFGSESDSSDPNIHYLQKQLDVGVIFFLNSSKNYWKILKKTFRKSFMFITASDFWPTTLLKSNSTTDVFLQSFINLARTVISHNTFRVVASTLRVFITSCPYWFLKSAVGKLFGKLPKILWRIATFYSYQVFLLKFCKLYGHMYIDKIVSIFSHMDRITDRKTQIRGSSCFGILYMMNIWT